MKAWMAGTGQDRPGHDECQTSDSQNYCVEVLIKLEAADPGLGLRTPQIIDGGSGLLGRLKHGAKPTRHLRQTEDGFGRYITVVGKNGCDNIDRAGALLQSVPRLPTRLHAREDIVGTRGGRIVVVLGRAHRYGEGHNCEPQAKHPHASHARLVRGTGIHVTSMPLVAKLKVVG